MTIYRTPAQRTKAWLDLRRGRVCSSEIHRIVDDEGNLKRGRSKAEPISAAVYTYVAELVAERVSGYVDAGPSFASAAMEYGTQHEAAARAAMEFETGIEFEQVGGCMSTCGRWWASGDGLYDGDPCNVAVCEIKIPLPKTQVAYLLDRDKLVADYKPQVCHEMLVSGAATGYLFAYGAGLNCTSPNVLVQIHADDPFIANLRAALERLDEIVRAACQQIGAPETMPIPAAEQTDREWFEQNFGFEDEAAAV